MTTPHTGFTGWPRATLSLLTRGLLLSLSSGTVVLAQDVWTGGGSDEFWSNPANWSTPPPAETHADIVMAGPGHLVNTADTTLFGSAPREWRLHSILFPDGAPNFLIHIDVVTIEATTTAGGIFNSSGKLQILDMDPGNVFTNTTAGLLTLENSTIGNQVLLENKGGTAANPEPGATHFLGASAGQATINNFGGYDINFDTAGKTLFGAEATAGNASISNIGGDSAQGSGGSTLFKDTATAGNAILHNLAATADGAAGGVAQFTGVNTEAGNATITNDGSSVTGSSSGARTIFTTFANAGTATITNQSGVTQAGATSFINASAGSALIINSGSGFFGHAGQTDFYTSSSAGAATIVNSGGEAFLGNGGFTTFHDSADAGTATLIANAGAPPTNNGLPLPGGLGGRIFFNDHSTGDNASVQVLGNGALDISGHATTGVTIGSIEGDGQVYLGGNTLSIRSTSQTSVIFYGSLHDGGDSGGTAGSLTKVGSGSFSLAATSDYTGATTVASGKLVVDGNIASSSGITVGAGAILGGHGFVSTIGGAGMIAPGDSPGILTATRLDPTGGTDFTFQFTQVGSPTYAHAAASGNDLLHLTDLVPLTASLSSANQITIDFSGASLADGQIYRGGFFTDTAIDDAMIDGATFFYLGLDGFDVHFDGFVTEPVADFADGSVTDGRVWQFEIENGSPISPVPEPTTYGLLGVIGLAAAVWLRRRSRR